MKMAMQNVHKKMAHSFDYWTVKCGSQKSKAKSLCFVVE